MKTVWTTLKVEGFHRWPDAPPHYPHLRHDHRHLFELRVETPVNHERREVSFEDLRHLLAEAWPGPELENQSCEQVATGIAERLGQALERPVAVTVSEDGESGSTVYFEDYGDL